MGLAVRYLNHPVRVQMLLWHECGFAFECARTIQPCIHEDESHVEAISKMIEDESIGNCHEPDLLPVSVLRFTHHSINANLARRWG